MPKPPLTPGPDRIEPQAPPERPPGTPPAERPPGEQPEIIPDTPDSDWPDSSPGEWQPPD